jgi:hypothetical protein
MVNIVEHWFHSCTDSSHVSGKAAYIGRSLPTSLPSFTPDHFMHNALKISPPPTSLLFFTVGNVIFHQFFSCPATGNDLSLCISVMAGGDNNTVGNIRHRSLGVSCVKVRPGGGETRKLLIRFVMSEQSQGWLTKHCVRECRCARTYTNLQKCTDS